MRGLLDEKASEYRVYKRRLHELDGHLGELTEIKAAAREAAAQLDFDEYEALLRQVDESYSVMASRAKEARARNALLRGRTNEAYEGFVSAAETWRSLDPAESVKHRLEYHRVLFDYGLRFEGAALNARLTSCDRPLKSITAPRRAKPASFRTLPMPLQT